MVRLEKIWEDQHNLNKIAEWRDLSIETLRTADLTKQGISQINWVSNLKESEKYYFIYYNEIFVGYCGLDKIHSSNRTAEISLLISLSHRGQQIGGTAIKELLKLGFDVFNLNLIFGEAYETTTNWEFWIKQGFKPEGILRQRKYWNGKYYDSTIFSMLKGEWKKINNDL